MVIAPDFEERITQGEHLADAIDMGQDLTSILAVDIEDCGQPLPDASDLDVVRERYPGDIVTLVNIDTDAYRRFTSSVAVRKNCTIPSWFNEEAMKAGVNFSAVLQEGLKEALGIK